MDIPRYNRTYCIIVDHFWPVYTYLASWSQCDQTFLKASKLVKTGNGGPNMDRIFLATRTCIGRLKATLDQICSILPQSDIPVITWYLRPRIHTSASMWTKSSILHSFEHTSPLTKWDYTVPLEALFCSVCHYLMSKSYVAYSDTILQDWQEWAVLRQMWP